MLKWFIGKKLDQFERGYGYDLGYARDLMAADLAALMAFQKATSSLTQYRRDIPIDAHYAAKIVATMAEDCGPCTQLIVTMALREGVAAETLRAIVEKDDATLPEHVRLVVHFARAAITHDLAADDLRAAITTRWGPRALASIAFALCAGRLFPTMKYALGHGHACTRITVAGTPVTVPA